MVDCRTVTVVARAPHRHQPPGGDCQEGEGIVKNSEPLAQTEQTVSKSSGRDTGESNGGRLTWLLDVRRRFGHEALLLVELPIRRILTIEIQPRFSVAAMIATLNSLSAHAGAPNRLLLDSAPRYHSNKIMGWCHKQGIRIDYLPRFGTKIVTARMIRNLDAAIVALGPDPSLAACQMVARAMEDVKNRHEVSAANCGS
jgi:hypothetical protein